MVIARWWSSSPIERTRPCVAHGTSKLTWRRAAAAAAFIEKRRRRRRSGGADRAAAALPTRYTVAVHSATSLIRYRQPVVKNFARQRFEALSLRTRPGHHTSYLSIHILVVTYYSSRLHCCLNAHETQNSSPSTTYVLLNNNGAEEVNAL